MLPSRVGEAEVHTPDPHQCDPRAVFGYGVHLLCGGARFADTLTEPELEIIDLCPLHWSAWKVNSQMFVTSVHRTALVTVAVALRRR